ncbi:hypothetical protein [Lapidilactobacillus dextrinicus]|uniref:hypothetical protein n=1 Tax=Lapidilactobacillus dextrinicus TaxID=51664 RepID=UPI003F2542CB
MRNSFLMNVTKTFLYLSSFFPLFVLLVIQNIKIRDEHGEFLKPTLFFHQFFEKGVKSPESIFWIAVLIFIIASILSIISFFALYIKADGSPGQLLGSNFERADTLGYIVTYIVPLISMNISSYRSLVINFGLFFIIGVFYIKNNQFFMNPIFNLLGYNILSSDSGTIYVTKLSPRKLKVLSQENETVSLKHIAEDTYVVREINH